MLPMGGSVHANGVMPQQAFAPVGPAIGTGRSTRTRERACEIARRRSVSLELVVSLLLGMNLVVCRPAPSGAVSLSVAATGMGPGEAMAFRTRRQPSETVAQPRATNLEFLITGTELPPQEAGVERVDAGDLRRASAHL